MFSIHVRFLHIPLPGIYIRRKTRMAYGKGFDPTVDKIHVECFNEIQVGRGKQNKKNDVENADCSLTVHYLDQLLPLLKIHLLQHIP